ncbi:MAG: undecaprenyl/decaprenyl-phosphate alpha-N-acetylglucosaminyl 1-phosphate transferase [Elusimicrobiota bacterium]|jgi:UDP-GlcNAc:undecaprenyl-phosphate GlcNAc-1-phosphate transferase|nr:undecaprenyl/decaprenyl-phosphate alpha-N-acetylglucosaminyl 1-phosphate transferase [Elusimicrobiota bacterium]
MSHLFLYLLALLIALLLCAASLPRLRRLLAPWLGDAPTKLKNHIGIVPAAGGCAVALGFFGSLTAVRLLTNFPTGTLTNLRGVFLGGALVFAAGIIDDIKKPAGISPWAKLACQILAAVILIHYGISVQFLPQPWGWALTLLWVAGITNAINLFDIMDGLAAGQAVLAAAAFAVISLPSEFIYVNFAAAALAGACLGFLPYNHSAKLKTFLGDSGSNLLGFLLAACALGAKYSMRNPAAVFVPLIILALPIFDTVFVSLTRISKGISPLKGTPDHFPLRLERAGLSRGAVLFICTAATLVYAALAYAITKAPAPWPVIIYALVAADLILFGVFLIWKTK